MMNSSELKKVLNEILFKEIGEVPSPEITNLIYLLAIKDHLGDDDFNVESLYISFKRDEKLKQLLKK